jgi:hypothetical protein
MEKLSEKEMKSTVFHPTQARHFIFSMKPIDAFLVEKVERVPYVWQKPGNEYESRKDARRLIVHLMDSIGGPSGYAQVQNLIEENWCGRMEAELKLLSPSGEVLTKFVFEGVRVLRVDYDPYSYSGNSLWRLRVELEYKKETILYAEKTSSTS